MFLLRFRYSKVSLKQDVQLWRSQTEAVVGGADPERAVPGTSVGG